MFPPLYAILDPNLTDVPLATLAVILADEGVQLIQLRRKAATASKLFAEARELAGVLSPRGVRFIVNDRPDIAAIAGAGGVHVGQDDLPVDDARRICAPPCWVGVSTHNLEQLRQADNTSADYIAVGPIFATGTKENPDPVVGVDFIRTARRITRKPLVAIGGITMESAAEVFSAGADSVAIVRDLLLAPDPGARVREYLSIANRARVARD